MVCFEKKVAYFRGFERIIVRDLDIYDESPVLVTSVWLLYKNSYKVILVRNRHFDLNPKKVEKSELKTYRAKNCAFPVSKIVTNELGLNSRSLSLHTHFKTQNSLSAFWFRVKSFINLGYFVDNQNNHGKERGIRI